MRVPRPPRGIRIQVLKLLHDSYDRNVIGPTREAYQILASYFEIPQPKVEFRHRPTDPEAKGQTWDDVKPGRIELIAPRSWARRRPNEHDLSHRMANTKEDWVFTALHEFYHVLSWIDEEAKADHFAARFEALL